MTYSFIAQVAVVVLVGLTGSRAFAQQMKPLTTPPSTQPATRPFVVGEAKLPEGFPAPGEVGKVVVKSYPAYRAARVTRDDVTGQDQMFGTLFKHIQQNDIKMTAPVEMTYATDPKDGTTAMSFLYATPTMGTLGADGVVQVIDVPVARVVSMAVRGNYSRETFDEAVVSLREWLSKHPEFKPKGQPRYLGYNSPFVPPFMRYGEVQIEVSEDAGK